MPGLIIEVQNRSQNPTKAQNEVKVQVRLRLCASLWLWTVRIFAFASRLDSASSQWLQGEEGGMKMRKQYMCLRLMFPNCDVNIIVWLMRFMDWLMMFSSTVVSLRSWGTITGVWRNQELEDRHLELENQHRQLKNQHEEMAGQHRHQDTSVNVIKCISIGLMIVLLLERISYFHDHLSGFLVCVVVLIICLIRHN